MGRDAGRESQPDPVEVEVPWTFEGRDYLVRLRYRLLPRVEVDGVCLVVPPGRDYPVTRVALRAIPLGELEAEHRPSRESVLREGEDRLDLFLDSPLFSDAERRRLKEQVMPLYEQAADEPAKRRGGRAPLGVEEVLPVAEAYVRAWEAGRTDVLAAVEEAFPHQSKWTLTRWIRRAKELGLIPRGVGPNRGGDEE